VRFICGTKIIAELSLLGKPKLQNIEYARRFQAAMAKAFAATDGNVRVAYFDLASFYHDKLRHPGVMYPPADELRRIVGNRAA
jgi:hypothetical protein